MGKRTGAVVALTAALAAGGCGTTTKAAAPSTTAAATTRNNQVSDADFKKIVEGLGYKSVTTSYDEKDNHRVATTTVQGRVVEIDQIGQTREVEIDKIDGQDGITAQKLGLSTLKGVRFPDLDKKLADPAVRNRLGLK